MTKKETPGTGENLGQDRPSDTPAPATQNEAESGFTQVKNANASGQGSIGRSEDDILAGDTVEEEPGEAH